MGSENCSEEHMRPAEQSRLFATIRGAENPSSTSPGTEPQWKGLFIVSLSLPNLDLSVVLKPFPHRPARGAEPLS